MSSEWQTYQLDELCDFTNGFAFKSTDYVEASEDTIEVFRMGYICRGGGFKEDNTPVFVPRAYGKSLEKYILKSGDVVIAMTDMKDKVAILGNTARIRHNSRFVLNQRVGCIRVKRHDLLSPEFLYFYSNSLPHVDYLRSRANSGVQVNLSTSAIKESQLQIPPLAEQKYIASILMALDERVTLLRETNTTLEAIAQALFKSWFVDFDPVRAKQQGTDPQGMDPSTAALFPESFDASELGEVPKGWRVGTLQDLLVLQRGFDLPSQDRVPGDFPIIAASGPSGTHFEPMAKGPGVITGRSGVLGRVFLELEDYWPLNTALWVKEFKAATPCYAYEILRLLDFASFNAGSAVPTLNRNHIHTLRYTIPNFECVKAYEEIAIKLHQRVKANQKQAQTLATLRDTLLPRLISGQLRLPA
jgi:type I restriction enzyme, S subunit